MFKVIGLLRIRFSFKKFKNYWSLEDIVVSLDWNLDIYDKFLVHELKFGLEGRYLKVIVVYLFRNKTWFVFVLLDFWSVIPL